MLANLVVLNLIRSQPLIGKFGRGDTGFKLSLETMKDTHVSPLGRLVNFRSKHCLKPIIKHDMVLRRNVSCLQVPDHSNVVSMDWGDPNKLCSARSRLPLGNLSSNRSKLGFEDIGWASPRMGIP